MKITINMDYDLLESVMTITGATTKTEAIHIALKDIVRRAKLLNVLKEGLGLSPEELRNAFDPASDPMKLRVGEGITPYQVTNRSDHES